MTTCGEICTIALRRLGVVGASRSPRPNDMADALAALSGLYGSWIASGAFGRIEDVPAIGTDFFATGNQRIIRTSADDLTVTLPVFVEDCRSTDYGHDGYYYGTVVTITQVGLVTTVLVEMAQPRVHPTTPRDGSVVIISDQAGDAGNINWLYDGTIKRWQSLDNLTADAVAPRSAADPQGLASMLAMEIADQFGGDALPATQRAAMRFQAAMMHRWGMRREATMGSYF